MHKLLGNASTWAKKQAKSIGIFGAGVVLAGASGAVLASIPDANGVIHGCIRNNGDLRIIDSATQQCTSAQDPISFNQTGPQGPAGATGPQGPAGPAGTSGSTLVSQLSNVDLTSTGVDWQYFNLTNINFHGTKFGGNITGASLVGSDLTGTEFSFMTMNNVDAHCVDFSGSLFFSGLRARNTNFSGANFTDATIYATDNTVNIVPVDLTNANLQNVNFTGADFLPTDSLHRRIIGGDFSNANFTNASLAGVNFDGGTFTGATWSNTVCPDGTNSNANGNTCSGHFTLP